MATENTQNYAPIFSCNNCDFYTCKKNDFSRHLQSLKHLRNNSQQSATKKTHICESCAKVYKDRTGLWRHKKTCIIDTNSPEMLDKELMIELLKNNSEMQKMMIKLIENGTNNIVNTDNSINLTNKTFNLNVYLNETCKDAMNISDFVSSIKVNLEDLENTGREGYIEGISNIIFKNLNNLEDHFRPLHCSDSKREILYIKDNNEWTKESDSKPILTKAIKIVANENIKQIKLWRDKYPDCTNSESRKNDLYLKIVSNSMNGLTEEESKKNIQKIISNVVKEVVINKN
jgi:hypothetical protein